MRICIFSYQWHFHQPFPDSIYSHLSFFFNVYHHVVFRQSDFFFFFSSLESMLLATYTGLFSGNRGMCPAKRKLSLEFALQSTSLLVMWSSYLILSIFWTRHWWKTSSFLEAAACFFTNLADVEKNKLLHSCSFVLLQMTLHIHTFSNFQRNDDKTDYDRYFSLLIIVTSLYYFKLLQNPIRFNIANNQRKKNIHLTSASIKIFW